MQWVDRPCVVICIKHTKNEMLPTGIGPVRLPLAPIRRKFAPRPCSRYLQCIRTRPTGLRASLLDAHRSGRPEQGLPIRCRAWPLGDPATGSFASRREWCEYHESGTAAEGFLRFSVLKRWAQLHSAARRPPYSSAARRARNQHHDMAAVHGSGPSISDRPVERPPGTKAESHIARAVHALPRCLRVQAPFDLEQTHQSIHHHGGAPSKQPQSGPGPRVQNRRDYCDPQCCQHPVDAGRRHADLLPRRHSAEFRHGRCHHHSSTGTLAQGPKITRSMADSDFE